MRDCPELADKGTPQTTSGVNRQVTTTTNLKGTDGNGEATRFPPAYEHLSTCLMSDDDPETNGLDCLPQLSTGETTTLQVHAGPGQSLTSKTLEHCQGLDVRYV